MRPTAVARGADKWLDVVRHPSPEACAKTLKARGYRIFVASMEGASAPENLLAEGPAAVIFGTEHSGVSETFRGIADGTFAVPMRGFVESLNVSVAAAVTFHAATLAKHHALSHTAQRELLRSFLQRCTR